MKSDYDFEKKLIIEQLLEVPEGETITYQELSSLSGLDLQGDFRYLLDSSLNFVLKHHRIDFRNIRNTGYKRLAPSETVHDNRSQNRFIGAAVKGQVRLTAADFERLSDSDRRTHNAKLAAFAMGELLATEKSIKQIETHIKDAKSTTIEARKALELFLSEFDVT